MRDYLLVPSVLMQWLFPVIITMAVYLFHARARYAGRWFLGRPHSFDSVPAPISRGGTRWRKIVSVSCRFAGWGPAS